jgi:GTPase
MSSLFSSAGTGPGGARTGWPCAEASVGIVGNVDAGKSTLVSVLVRGSLDDGRGRARTAILKHAHERVTGRTSSIAREIMGFEADGMAVGVRTSLTPASAPRVPDDNLRWSQIMECARDRGGRVITLLDLAGHEKYLKTTVFGLTTFCPHLVLIVIGANTGRIVGTTREHLGLAIVLGIPIAVVVTKIDMAPKPVLQETHVAIRRLLASFQRKALLVSPADRVDGDAPDLGQLAVEAILAQLRPSQRRPSCMNSSTIVPIFPLSCLTGIGLPALRYS